MNTKTAGKKGGLTTLKKHGKKHFSIAGRKGMASRWKKELTNKPRYYIFNNRGLGFGS